MPPEQGLDVPTFPCADRRQLGDDSAPAHNREPFPVMLHRVEQVREAPRCFGRTYFGHEIRLSNFGLAFGAASEGWPPAPAVSRTSATAVLSQHVSSGARLRLSRGVHYGEQDLIGVQ